jgi:regulatory protein
VARAICLRQLTAGPRTRAQLAEALARRAVPADVAANVLDRFEDVGLINDSAFASAWVDSRRAGRGLARRALASELRQRGVAEPVIAEAVDGVDADQELATARDLVARRLPATRGLPPETRLRRLSGLLARKGYPPGLAFRVVREALVREGDELAALPGPDE